MAYDPSSATQYFGVTIYLDGLTWRLSDREFTLSDGSVFLKLISSVSPLARSAGSLQDPRVVLPSMTLILDNKADPQDGTRAQDTVLAYEFANARAVLSVGSSLTTTDWTDLFDGRVRFPGGVSSDDLQVEIRINDARAKDGRTLPATVFDSTTYPNADPAIYTLPIPIVYGDWYTTAGGGEVVPCYQINSTTGTGGKFKISSRELKSIEAVYKNGSSVSFTGDLNNGEFTLNVAYTQGTDVVTANVRGCTDDQTSGGTLLQSAPDVLSDILQQLMGVDAAYVNSTAFSTWETELTTSDYVRRWIGGTTVHTDALISELLNEGFADMRIEAGKYYPAYRITSPGTALTTFRDSDLLSSAGNTAVKQFTVHNSPEDIYCNEAQAQYLYDPVAGDYGSLYVKSDEAAVSRTQQRVRRSMTLNWLYITAGVQARVEREVYAFSSNVTLVNVGIDASALTYGPGSQLRLVYGQFEEDSSGDGNPFQVRDIQVDPMQRRATALLWDMYSLLTGTWTEDDSVTWLTATATQRNSKGFWSDDSGYADTSGSPDATSQRYRWA